MAIKNTCSFCKGKHSINRCKKKEKYDFLLNNPEISNIMEYIYGNLYKHLIYKNIEIKRNLAFSRNFVYIKKTAEKIIEYGMKEPSLYIDFCMKKFGKREFFKWRNVEKNYIDFLNYYFTTWDEEKINESFKKITKIIENKKISNLNLIRNMIYSKVIEAEIHPVVYLHYGKNLNINKNDGIDWGKWKTVFLLKTKKEKRK